MKELNPKFVVVNDSFTGLHIVLGKCVFHKELPANEKFIISGGWFEVNIKDKIFTLYGKSEQFGRASLEEVLKCVKTKKVYGDKRLIKNLTDTFSFQYREIGGKVTKLE